MRVSKLGNDSTLYLEVIINASKEELCQITADLRCAFYSNDSKYYLKIDQELYPIIQYNNISDIEFAIQNYNRTTQIRLSMWLSTVMESKKTLGFFHK